MLFRTALFSFLFATCIAAADPVTVTAVRMDKPPVIDGVIDEANEWKSVPYFEGMVDSITRAAAPESARFWLGYDDQFLYFAAKLHDRLPESIRAGEYRTNVALTGEDYVELDISPSGNLSDFDTFQMNARGATNVALAGGRATKREWAGEILSKARVTPDGWEVETRIPWRIFRLPGAGKHDVRFNIQRAMPRMARTFIFAYTSDGNAAETPILQGVLLPKLSTDRSIKLLPYGYLGYDQDQGRITNAGMDVKTNLSDSAVLVGSVNPDFRNIENQVLSLDFSRFERLAGESRPFFQEGSGYLNSNLYASQRISGFDVGVNTYGKLDPKTQYGFLNTTTFGKENDLVSNVTYSPNANESYRATFTRLTTPGLENNAALFRYSRNIGNYGVFLRDEQSTDTVNGHGEDDTVTLSYSHQGLYSEFDLDRATPNFTPRLGFQPQIDYMGPTYVLAYERGSAKEALIDTGVTFVGYSYRHVSGGFYNDDANIQVFGTFRNQLNLTGTVDLAQFQDDQDHTFSLATTYPQSDRRHQFTLTVTSGMQAEQLYDNYNLAGTYYYGRNLSTTVSYQIVKLGTDFERQAILSGNYDLGHDRSVSGRLLQQNDGTNFFLSFQQTGNRGTEYYLILGNPNADVVDNSKLLINMRTSIILKVVMPFQIGHTA